MKEAGRMPALPAFLNVFKKMLDSREGRAYGSF
jgi:hypothetical protein